jgi:hypothetical protein
MKPGDKVTWVFSAGGRCRKPVLIEAVIVKTTSKERVKIKFPYQFMDERRFGNRSVLMTTLLPHTQAGLQLGGETNENSK